jgi:hypothetical protein
MYSAIISHLIVYLYFVYGTLYRTTKSTDMSQNIVTCNVGQIKDNIELLNIGLMNQECHYCSLKKINMLLQPKISRITYCKFTSLSVPAIIIRLLRPIKGVYHEANISREWIYEQS